MWNDIPTNVQAEFLPFGPVKTSVATHDGARSNTIYIWTADGREIGFYNTISQMYSLFAPNFRQWSDEFMASQIFETISR